MKNRWDIDRTIFFLTLLLLTLVGGYQRLSLSQYFWLSPDEGLYLTVSSEVDRMRYLKLAGSQAHPLLFFEIVRVLHQVVSDPLFPRVVSLVSGTLLIPVLGLIGYSLAGTTAGILAATLTALNPCLLSMSILIRPYSLVILLTSLILYIVTFCWQAEVRLRTQALLIGTLALIAPSVHYGTFFSVGIILSSVILSGLLSKRVSSFIMTYSLLLALTMTLFVFFWFAHISGLENAPWWSHYKKTFLEPGFVAGIGQFFELWKVTLAYQLGSAWPFYLVFYLVGAYQIKKLKGYHPAFITFALTPIFITVFSILGKYPLGGIRYQSIFIAPYVVCACVGMSIILKPFTNWRYSQLLIGLTCIILMTINLVGLSGSSIETEERIRKNLSPGEQMLSRRQFDELTSKIDAFCGGDCLVALDLGTFFILATKYADHFPKITPPTYSLASSLGEMRILATWELGWHFHELDRAKKEILQLLPPESLQNHKRAVMLNAEWNPFPTTESLLTESIPSNWKVTFTEAQKFYRLIGLEQK
jgi:hypothetical protein